MHAVTFYSFKGGVGRTLALANIGVELARTGRKVLLVDFDLEAPGIDTFKELAPPTPCKGIVDYISEYVATGSPREFRDYHYAAQDVEIESGDLWVMPAGQRDAAYGSKLASIDWPELYDQRDGFLLIEHLKSQWKETLNPDYVLIDSRTGHTEVGGICTRQLPNTVVVLFIPNEQNRTGVSFVIDAINAENSDRRSEEPSDRDEINIELVASNVPSLDDEYQILRTMLRKFEKLVASGKGRRRSPIATINRYDSMHLLNQTLFITERPQSRLSKQYRALMQRIVEHNLEDREAALREISSEFPHPRNSRRFALRAADFESVTSPDVERKIHGVLEHHAGDAEINFMIGQLHKSRGDLDEAELFFSRAAEIAAGKNDPNSAKYELELLETLINKGKGLDTTDKLVELLNSEMSAPEVRQAIGLLTRTEPNPARDWLDLPALKIVDQDDLDNLAWPMCISRQWQEFAIALYRKNVGCVEKPRVIRRQVNLMLAAIGTENYDLVLDSISEEVLLTKCSIETYFNYAMARWGQLKQPDGQLFARVIELDGEHRRGHDANYEQCLAISLAICHAKEAAKARLERSRLLAGEFSPSEFSCWSYLRVDQQQFTADLEEVELFLEDRSIQPRFMRQDDLAADCNKENQ